MDFKVKCEGMLGCMLECFRVTRVCVTWGYECDNRVSLLVGEGVIKDSG